MLPFLPGTQLLVVPWDCVDFDSLLIHLPTFLSLTPCRSLLVRFAPECMLIEGIWNLETPPSKHGDQHGGKHRWLLVTATGSRDFSAPNRR